MNLISLSSLTRLSAAIMVTTIKVTMLAYNVRDGRLLAANPSTDALHEQWKQQAVLKMPSPLEFYSYLCFFPTFLAGPAFHFRTFRDWIEDRLYMEPKFNPTGKAPSALLPALWVFLQALLSLVIHVLLGTFFPSARLFQAEAFADTSFLYPMFYLYLAMLGVRCQYYFAWKLSEGAGILSGLGFNGYGPHGTPIWDRLCNAHVLKIEGAGSVRDLTIVRLKPPLSSSHLAP